ncbi:MAG: tRNA (guanosine(37)-N1)-methyltransferase TrmD [Eubacteriales bacterium]|nr:tRNA (guanosine(37)-N1)-methyltransferase TrmD [Clostridiales bacterium]MDD7307495.1 tRNA (guanosine(37)-N1)-methyltransferase TrmD [Eubacteriales bacterium]MDY2933239.1 tRNA (guanosine(37)-N1)-methyltransferase TrmD [Anaerovoracaceae bacterium]MEE0181524.1 tRNA (guanosine(37)-N1)-methyltransferase TrmD [Anaerovoracaceae bacterium]
MKIDILTLFPEMFVPVTTSSILGRAAEKNLIDIRLTDIREYTKNKHRKVDDYPFGGGQGMVMMPQPIFDALRGIKAEGKKILYMSPRGRVLDKDKIQELSQLSELVILCGHYEGVDQRVIDCWEMEEVSIGDYILTGGELPAMVLVDSVARLIPGVLSGEDSAMEESVYSGLLEYPQYTQPREYEDIPVPEILLSGHHKNIDLWRFEKSLELTRKVRPDMFENYCRERTQELDKAEKKILQKVTDEK